MATSIPLNTPYVLIASFSVLFRASLFEMYKYMKMYPRQWQLRDIRDRDPSRFVPVLQKRMFYLASNMDELTQNWNNRTGAHNILPHMFGSAKSHLITALVFLFNSLSFIVIV